MPYEEREERTEETTVRSSPDSTVRTTRSTVTPSVRGEHVTQSYQKKKTIFQAWQVIWYIVGVMEALLGLRFLFRLLGANPASGFVDFLYSLTAPLTAPFRGIFPPVASEGAVLEWSTLVAMLIYLLIGYGIVYLLRLFKPPRPEEVETSLE